MNTSNSISSGALIAIAARQKLASLSFPELRSVKCAYHEGVLTLRGEVNRFFLRQMALSAARSVPGVDEVVDELQVCNERDESLKNRCTPDRNV